MLIGCQDSGSFKFALFSDTHVFETGTGAADLRLAVADVNRHPEIEFVLVSGDITEMNIGNNLILAKQILDRLNVPYYIIPGNHDTKWSGSAGANFRHIFSDDKFVFDNAGFKFIGFHQGPVLRMDDGHISADVLHWLKIQLEKSGSEQPIILVMHYPLDSSIDNWFECVNIIKDSNIKAILHGHGHRNRIKYYQGIPGIMGRSTLRRNEDKSGYTVFEMRNDSLIYSEQIVGENGSSIWGGISLKTKYDISQVADSLLPDYSVNKKYPGINIQWFYQSNYLTTASPLVYENTVYIGDGSGTMNALSIESGKIIWKNQVSDAIYGTAAAANDHLVFTSADSNIYGLNAMNGSLVWKFPTNNALVSVPTIKNDVVFVGTSDGIFRAISLYNGELVWDFKNVNGYVETKPAIYKDKVIFGAWDGKLYCLDRKTGKQIWIWQGEKPSPLYAPAACWSVIANNKVFIAAPDRYVTAINLNSGHALWRNNRWKFRETVGVSQNGKYVFARSMTDSVVSFSSFNSAPKIVWAADFEYGYDIAPSMPIEKNGTLFWGTKNGIIVAADANSGKTKWKYKYKNYLINTVYPVNDHSVIFSNIDGDVVLLSYDPD